MFRSRILACLLLLGIATDISELRKLTCVMPMEADQSLAESVVWTDAAKAAADHVRSTLHQTGQEILETPSNSGVRLNEEGHEHARVRTATLLQWADSEAEAECRRRSDERMSLESLDASAVPSHLVSASRKYVDAALAPLPGTRKVVAKPFLTPPGGSVFPVQPGHGMASVPADAASVPSSILQKLREAAGSGADDAGASAAVESRERQAPGRRLLQGSQATGQAGRLRCHAEAGSFCLSSLQERSARNSSSSVSMSAADRIEACVLARSIFECPPGFYCPGGEAAPLACARGQRCPSGSKEPLACPEGRFCPVSLVSVTCPASLECPRNTTLPQLCRGGRYCPKGQSRTCPPGHFCAPGSSQPEPCAGLADCPEGSAFEDWHSTARWSFALGLLLWGALVRTVPPLLCLHLGHCPVAALLPMGILGPLWGLQFGLLPLPSGVTPQAAFGGSPHVLPIAFLTLNYAFLLYGLLISRRITSAWLQLAADLLVFAAICAALASCIKDASVLLFLGNIWGVFVVLWLLFTQQGPWHLRVALLAVALLALALACLWFQASELTQMLLCTLMISVAKELVLKTLPLLLFNIKKKRVETLQSGLNDAPIRPLINSLASLPLHMGSNPEAHPAIAARVAASAHASLSLAAVEPWEAPAGRGSRRGQTSDPEAAVAWAEHHRACAKEAQGTQEARTLASEQVGDSSSCKLSFRLRGVGYRLDDKRRLLHDVSFCVPGGTRVAVMGASGSGKTTLLSVLSGRCGDGRFEGEMCLNGATVLPWQMASLRPLMGYVPQDDVMHTALTVRENLQFQAELRLHVGESELELEGVGRNGEQAKAAQRQQRLRGHVEAIMAGLGLAHVADRAVGDNLSGGQRKRVSIGMELVSKPRVLLLDEPSTGLDASTAHRILEMVLGHAASEQCTTFSTIHQPRWSTLGLFDMLVLLAPGGYLCYAGPVLAVKAYFEEFMHLDFPVDENPADSIIEACTFDSARSMAVESQWKHPPQCLRAVLFPTPEAVGEDCRLQWQQEEFGQILAALWRKFCSSQAMQASHASQDPGLGSHSHSHSRLEAEVAAQAEGGEAGATPLGPACTLQPQREARQFVMQALELERPAAAGVDPAVSLWARLAWEAQSHGEKSHWAQQVWLQLVRTLLITSRALWPTITMHVILLTFVMTATLWATSGTGLSHIFMPTGLALLLLSLAQSVAAQRIFGGEERQVAWREASVCSLRQVFWGFVGKDLASLVEITLGAVCFALTYWPNANTFASVFDIYAIGFAFLYAVWGLNFVWSVIFPPHTAMMFAVTACFLSFLFSGLKPEAAKLVGSLGGYGKLLLLASPIRWAMSHFIFRHVTGRGSTYFEHSLQESGVAWIFRNRGYDLDHIAGVGRQCPSSSSSPVIDRWSRRDGLLCHSGQLFLLGILFRFIAATCLLITSSAKASGGQLPLGISSRVACGVLRDALFALLVFFVLLQLILLGETT